MIWTGKTLRHQTLENVAWARVVSLWTSIGRPGWASPEVVSWVCTLLVSVWWVFPILLTMPNFDLAWLISLQCLFVENLFLWSLSVTDAGVLVCCSILISILSFWASMPVLLSMSSFLSSYFVALCDVHCTYWHCVHVSSTWCIMLMYYWKFFTYVTFHRTIF